MTTTVQLPRGATQSCRPTTLPRANSPADIEMIVLELRDGDVEMTMTQGELDSNIEMVDSGSNEDVEMGDLEVRNVKHIDAAEDVEMVDSGSNEDVEMGDLEVRNVENIDADVAKEEPTGEDVEMVDGNRTDDVEIENA